MPDSRAGAPGGAPAAPGPGPSDEELLARVQRGEPEALRALMERYRRPLHGYLVRLLASPEDADDLFQEVFLRVLRAAARFEPGRRFRPWLYTIATNLVRNTYRARGYRQAVPLDRAADEEGTPLSALLPGRARSPVEAAAGAERAARVREAVDALPEKGRAALVLFYFQGLPYEEIAQVLEVPLGTVKSRIHNAMARLAATLGAAEEVSS